MIEAVAKSADISKAAAEKALDGALGAIKGAAQLMLDESPQSPFLGIITQEVDRLNHVRH